MFLTETILIHWFIDWMLSEPFLNGKSLHLWENMEEDLLFDFFFVCKEKILKAILDAVGLKSLWTL